MAWAVYVGVLVGCGSGPGDGADGSTGAGASTEPDEPTSADASTGTGASTGTTGPGESANRGFDEQVEEYAACGPPLEPLCVGLECATDEVSTKYMTMIGEELADAGVEGWIRATNGRVFPDSNQVLYHLQSQVAWYRYWTPESIRTTDPDDEVRAQVRQGIEALAAATPADIIDLAVVKPQAAACDGMQWSLCIGHVTPGSISFLRETGDPCNGGTTDEFSIDLVSGESVCTLDAPVSCGR